MLDPPHLSGPRDDFKASPWTFSLFTINSYMISSKAMALYMIYMLPTLNSASLVWTSTLNSGLTVVMPAYSESPLGQISLTNMPQTKSCVFLQNLFPHSPAFFRKGKLKSSRCSNQNLKVILDFSPLTQYSKCVGSTLKIHLSQTASIITILTQPLSPGLLK